MVDVAGNTVVTVGGDHVRFHRQSWVRFLPGFVFVLLLYMAGRYAILDPRASLLGVGQYRLSWVEVLNLVATFVAMFEMLKVSHPGINNTLEALFMGVVAAAQLVCFALGVAGVHGFEWMFSNTEFLILLLINLGQVVLAFMLNARTLQRTVGIGDSN